MSINSVQIQNGCFYWYKLDTSELCIYFQSNTGIAYKATGDYWELIGEKLK